MNIKKDFKNVQQYYIRNIIKLGGIILFLFSCFSISFGGTILFQENFEDSNFASRGWYDTTGGVLSTTEHIPGSTKSYECRFLQGGQGCNGGNPGRHKFTPSNSVYVSYWIKHSSNWVGSGKTYHPHIFYVLTNLNGDYAGPAYTYLAAYIEENQGYPALSLQDGQNIDETKVGQNLIGVTENRAVAGCNGTQANIGQDSVSCYLSGSVHWNGIVWKGATAYFFDVNQKNNWHLVEAFFQLNSVSNGIGQPDGVIRYWYDGQLVIDHSNIIIRTGKNPTMQFNQLIIGPWIGDGSPADQRFWIDNLTVATSRGDTIAPSPPQNLR